MAEKDRKKPYRMENSPDMSLFDSVDSSWVHQRSAKWNSRRLDLDVEENTGAGRGLTEVK